jgi:hypothetical protein
VYSSPGSGDLATIKSGGDTSKIMSYLHRRGFDISGPAVDAVPPDPALDALALLMSFQFSIFRPLLRNMRGRIRQAPSFYVDLDGLIHNERGNLKNLFHMMHRNGLLARYATDGRRDRIHGETTTTDRAVGFLTGQWLERCIRINIQSFLNLQSHRVEISHNIQVVRPPQRDGKRRMFEFDALLAVDDDIYWWEAKCGHYKREHLLRYQSVASELGLPHERCLLILAEPDNCDMSVTESKSDTRMASIAPQDIARKVEEIEDYYKVDIDVRSSRSVI